MEKVVLVSNFFIHIQDSSYGGWDYTIYHSDSLKEVDGGIYDEPEASMDEVLEEIANDLGINIHTTCYEEMDADVFFSLLEAV